MSKKKQKAEKRALTPNEKKAIIISAIAIAMAAILTVTLVLILRPDSTTPDSSDSSSSGSSSLYIRNGDFAYYDKDIETYPRSADNWSKYTYKEKESDSLHTFDTKNDNIVSGVVDTNEEVWAKVQEDLKNAGITQTVSNPSVYNADDMSDSNVYMFAAKSKTTASIASTSFTVASQSSAKITVRLNTSQLKEGDKAIVMIQRYSSTLSALEKINNNKDANWYAYDFEIGKEVTSEHNGWITREFYVFNRASGSRSVVCMVGLGNVYTGEGAEGVLFVDDISYETVSANEYRKYVDGVTSGNQYGIISDSTVKIPAASDYATVVNYDSSAAVASPVASYLDNSLSKMDEEGESYSPFTKEDNFKLYTVSNDGTKTNTVALVLDSWKGAPIVVKSAEEESDHLHVSFWLRIAQNNKTAQGHIILQSLQGSEWEDVNSGSFSSIVTSQNIDTDNNCGWTKYDIYVKPTTTAETTVRLVISLGNIKGYANSNYIPDGTLFMTSPYVENIDASDYSSASSGSYTKKISLVGDTASTTVTNGSFSATVTNSSVQPSSWEPAFAGENKLYKDGNGDDTIANINKTMDAVDGCIVKNNALGNAPAFDDSEQNILKIENKLASSYGYVSADISLSSRTVYAFSVLANVGAGNNPYIYIIKNGAESREKAIIGKIETAASNVPEKLDNKFGMIDSSDEGNGWVRYYIIIITGDQTETVRIALFNGKIADNNNHDALATGTVYYDGVCMTSLGTYTVDTAEYEEGEKVLRDRINFTAASGYTAFEELSDKEISDMAAISNVSVNDINLTSIVEKALEDAAKSDDDDSDSTAADDKKDVDYALLFSVISSVALVGALLIVVVVRAFKKRSKQ